MKKPYLPNTMVSLYSVQWWNVTIFLFTTITFDKLWDVYNSIDHNMNIKNVSNRTLLKGITWNETEIFYYKQNDISNKIFNWTTVLFTFMNHKWVQTFYSSDGYLYPFWKLTPPLPKDLYLREILIWLPSAAITHLCSQIFRDI